LILIDFSGMIISTMTVLYTKNLSLEMVRHATLTSVLYAKKKFPTQGELVFACDDSNNWRKQIYPYYKANRKKDREGSSMDWNMLFQYLNQIKAEFKENLPYKFLQVETAEADDIIAALVLAYPSKEKIIYSQDGDFTQLLKHPNTKLWSPKTKKFVTSSDPHKYLMEHIMEGDSSDGVPNILSADNVFIDKIRQTRCTQKFKDQNISELMAGRIPFTGVTKERFQRNRAMIDLSTIPDSIYQESVRQYEATEPADRSKLFPYFFGLQMTKLMERLQEF
jgi:hypothetical protein